MRLFIAVGFEDGVKDALAAAQKSLAPLVAGARWTRREHMHLTLVFLGEVAPRRAEDAARILEDLVFPAFAFEIAGLGVFRRQGGSICWAGLRPCAELTRLQENLAGALRAGGFSFDDRPFSPHITLAREAVFHPGDTAANAGFDGVSCRVGRVSLLRSERIGGALVYTPIAERDAR